MLDHIQHHRGWVALGQGERAGRQSDARPPGNARSANVGAEPLHLWTAHARAPPRPGPRPVQAPRPRSRTCWTRGWPSRWCTSCRRGCGQIWPESCSCSCPCSCVCSPLRGACFSLAPPQGFAPIDSHPSTAPQPKAATAPRAPATHQPRSTPSLTSRRRRPGPSATPPAAARPSRSTPSCRRAAGADEARRGRCWGRRGLGAGYRS